MAPEDIDGRFFASLARIGLVDAAPVRLSGGRSNAVWRVGDLVIKRFEPQGGNPLFDNDPKREVASLKGLAGTGMVPSLQAMGHFEGCDWVAYHHIEGERWSSDPAHVAQLLGRLHDQPAPEWFPAGANGSEDLERQTRAILVLCRNGSELSDSRPAGVVPPLQKGALIHGDPVPGNLLAHHGTLTLIDWQCPQIGDPAEDLAIFLSPAMQLLYRGAPLPKAEVDAFLAAYPDPRCVGRYLALRPWYHWRMAAYCLWKSAQGDPADRQAMALELQALRSISPNAK